MAQTLVASSSLSDIANAIREKNGTTTLYKPREMGDAVRNIKIYNNVINSIIEQYKAQSDTIDANTFVEFVNGIVPGIDTTLVDKKYSPQEASAVLIGDDKVFIAHRSDETNNYLNGVVCTISGTTITPGVDTVLVNVSDAYYGASTITLVDKNKVFIVHRGSGQYLNGIVCTINGMNITPGTDTAIVSVVGTYIWNSVVLLDSNQSLDSNKMFIAHNSGDNYLNGVVCSVDGTRITPSTDTVLINESNLFWYLSAVRINSNMVFITHGSDTTNYYLNGIVCTINSNRITPGADTVLINSKTNVCQSSSPILLDIEGDSYGSFRVLVLHQSDGSNRYLNGIICTIFSTQAGESIIPGTDTIIVNVQNSSYNSEAVLIATNKVFISHNAISNRLNGIICTISGTTITPGIDTTIVNVSDSCNYASTVLIGVNKIFIAHRGTNYYLNGIVCAIENLITPSSTKIEGLTKTECTTSVAGDVWALRKMFSFLIGDNEYLSYENMTWSEWISSDFNTNNFYIGEVYDGYAVKRDDSSGEYEYYLIDDTICNTQIEVENLVVVEDSYVESSYTGS